MGQTVNVLTAQQETALVIDLVQGRPLCLRLVTLFI